MGEILKNYKNIKRLTINLNFLFEEDKKDKFFDKLTQFSLKDGITTFCCEDAILNEKTLD